MCWKNRSRLRRARLRRLESCIGRDTANKADSDSSDAEEDNGEIVGSALSAKAKREAPKPGSRYAYLLDAGSTDQPSAAAALLPSF